ncbi:MAG: FHIPEP family type III secretion protein [Lachnospiraceae bacterium]|nr:FHIPEP family type III secretion protein [Lachnospiraceae bacterium]
MQNNIGETICQYRQMRKMTQEEFASRLGVTAQAVSKWERGNGMPDVSLLAGICKVLGVSAGALIGVEESVVENGNITADREIKNNMIAEPLVLEFGVDLISYIVSGLETDYVNKQRMILVKKTGKLMPLLRIRDNTELKENEYRISAFDNVLFSAFIDENEEESYKRIIDDVANVCDKHYGEILNKNIVKLMIDNLSELYPGIVDDIIPSKISYLQIKEELKKRIEEGKSIRNLVGILEDMEMNM